LKALRASPLDDLGLSLALTAMVRQTTANSSLVLDLSIINEIPVLSPDVEQCIYRVAQEAVLNAVKHANAGNLAVRLESKDGKTMLTVQDDGVGFNTDKKIESTGFGLIGMQERAQFAGADLTIKSSRQSGTIIMLKV
jgi:signal transduction histidine kinase